MKRFHLAPAVAAGLGAIAACGGAFAQAPDPGPGTGTGTPAPATTTPDMPPPPAANTPTPAQAAMVNTDTAPGSFAFPGSLPVQDSVSFAQNAALAPLDPTAILNPLGLGASLVRRVQVSPSVTVTYDSNVARGGAVVASERGLSSGSDEIISPTVALDINQPFGRGAAFLSGSVGYNFYLKDTILNRENLNLTGGYSTQLGACHGSGTVGYSRGLNQLTDIVRGTVEDTYSTVTVGADVGCGGSIGFAPVAAVSETFSQNTQSLLSTSNVRVFSGSAGLAYQTPTNGTLSLFGQYQTTDFPNRGVILGVVAQNDGYKLYAGGVKYARSLGARIQGTLSASYTVTNAQGSQSFKGITYSANGNYRASSRLSFAASVGRDVTPSNTLDATYSVADHRSIEAIYTHGGRWTLSFGVSEQIGEQYGGSLIPLFDLQHYDDKSVFAQATYTLRRINFSFVVRNDHRDSNQALLDYSDTRASLTAATTF
jgi:hypothetical protein